MADASDPAPATRFHIASSTIHGSGLFARGSIPIGERLFRVEGRVRRFAFDENYALGATWFAVAPGRWIEPDRTHPAAHLNHSCAPNVAWTDTRWIVAISDIADGNELVLDYATTEIDPVWQMPCACHASACRGVVRAAPHEPASLRRRIARVTPSFLRRHWLKIDIQRLST
jgi:hypothetical protein